MKIKVRVNYKATLVLIAAIATSLLMFQNTAWYVICIGAVGFFISYMALIQEYKEQYGNKDINDSDTGD